MTTPEMITMNDVTNAGFCARGARRWFEAYGFDFREFLKNGIAVDLFLATDDALAQKVVDKKRELAGG